jgi:hypothetical protein
MRVFDNATFSKVLDHDGQTFDDLEFTRCTFRSSGLITRSRNLSRRPLIRNVRLSDCIVHSSYLDGAIIEDVSVHNLQRRHSPLFLRANAYRHVTLTGKISAVEIRGKLGVMDQSHDDEWDRANSRYYRNVDWSLDISDARFASFSISGIPTRLIKRDPETTGVVTRERALEGKWRHLAYNSGLFHIVISQLIKEGYDDCLLIACRGSSKFSERMEDLEMLRNNGIAM